MYFGPDNPRRGETLFAWVTGTAGWMFRAVVQYMMGFHPDYEGFTLAPCIPSAWGEVTLTRKFRGDTYNVTIKNESGAQSGVKSVTLDGVEVGASIKLVGDGNTHNVVVTM
jgi:cellobiose phosphorylase